MLRLLRVRVRTLLIVVGLVALGLVGWQWAGVSSVRLARARTYQSRAEFLRARTQATAANVLAIQRRIADDRRQRSSEGQTTQLDQYAASLARQTEQSDAACQRSEALAAKYRALAWQPWAAAPPEPPAATP